VNLYMKIVLLIALSVIEMNCAKSGVDPTPVVPPAPVTNDMDFWLTKADQSVNLQKQTVVLGFGTTYNMYPNIEIDDTQTFQRVDGFGYTLTGGSAQVINSLAPAKKQELLQELFGAGSTSISISI